MTSPEVTVIARRRRFSLERKQQILAEAERTSMAAVARQHGISRSLLQRWKLNGVQAGSHQDFVRLLPAGEAGGPAPATGSIFVHVDAAIVVELPASSDPTLVASLVGALRR